MRVVQRWLAVTIVVLLAISLQPLGTFAAPEPERAHPPAVSGMNTAAELIVRVRPEFSSDDLSTRFDGAAPGAELARRLARQVDDRLESRRVLTADGNTHLFTFENDDAATAALADLQDDPAVEFVEPNYERELHWVPATEEHWEDQAPWVETMRLPDAWNITTGDEQLIVAVIDSGVSPTHPDLVDKMVPGFNAIDGSDNSADIEGHGTRVAGIIAAAGDNGIGTAGVAMDVRIMPIRVLTDDNKILVTSIHDAIIWAVDNGADVINLSLGSEKASEAERSAVQYAYNNNVPIIASSGNRFNRISYPASYPEAISVGSLDANGNRSRFSSIISSVDVAAPGERLFSPGWNENDGDYWGDQLGNGRWVEGTSFSAAIVSGVVALQKSINPNLGVEEIRGILTSTALDTGDPGPESGVGAGQVDGEAAVRSVAFEAMYTTWYPTDFPVTTGSVTRTWLWGENPPATYAYEEYAEAQHNSRLVYYYDKSRMEITYPLRDRNEQWYVTNGLLVNELISGEMQVGDGTFETRQPAQVNVAGDPDDTLGPTYASFAGVLDTEPLAQGEVITQVLSRSGEVTVDESFAIYDVWAEYLDETTNHRVADVFWNYLNSYGTVQYGDELVADLLFDPWFYATGLPVTGAYWSEVTVAGDVYDVLMQCFERRCMTYTPANDPGWRVEMGNVGLHYYAWRYGDDQPVAPVDLDPPAAEVLYQSTLEDWPEATFSSGATFFEDGAYHIQATDPDGQPVISFAPESGFDDFTVTVDVQLIGEPGTSEACLVARAQEGYLSGYWFCIDSVGETLAYYQVDDNLGGNDVRMILEREFREQANSPDEWNTLGIFVQLDRIIFRINEKPLADSTILGNAARTGTVAIAVENEGDTPAEYAFRDLIVTGVAPAS